ncbi:hypothetical protein [Alkalihalobacterium elongatum]|uniref:hypothetical protein n=1 Tax=Alkalihalobacterium elongatum TaxID=2675466 RepID=UPI001C1FB9D0|nr:hypothetical protein [Alkalihalobacterium elongatum]
MKVKINGIEVELFHGATLKHALLKINENLYRDVINREAIIRDQEGNITDLNGAAGSNFCYTVEST